MQIENILITLYKSITMNERENIIRSILHNNLVSNLIINYDRRNQKNLARERLDQYRDELLIHPLHFHNLTHNGHYRLNFNHPVRDLIWVIKNGYTDNQFSV